MAESLESEPLDIAEYESAQIRYERELARLDSLVKTNPGDTHRNAQLEQQESVPFNEALRSTKAGGKNAASFTRLTRGTRYYGGSLEARAMEGDYWYQSRTHAFESPRGVPPTGVLLDVVKAAEEAKRELRTARDRELAEGLEDPLAIYNRFEREEERIDEKTRQRVGSTLSEIQQRSYEWEAIDRDLAMLRQQFKEGLISQNTFVGRMMALETAMEALRPSNPDASERRKALDRMMEEMITGDTYSDHATQAAAEFLGCSVEEVTPEWIEELRNEGLID